MESYNCIQIASPIEPLFSLAADITRWPQLLPHYRWIKILSRQDNRLTVEMAARHKGLPLWWKSIQTVSPEKRRIHYTHIGGITRGMEVDWSFTLIPSPPLGEVTKTTGDSPDVWRGAGEGDSPPSSPSPAREEGNKKLWRVEIRHLFKPPWPLFGPWVAERIIGKMFVEQIAGKTLACLKKIIEEPPSPPPSPLEGEGVRPSQLKLLRRSRLKVRGLGGL